MTQGGKDLQTHPAQRVPLVALYTANVISAIGDILMILAVPWFVLQTTGSVARTGITAFFTTASVALSALLGSAVVDRLGFRRASVVSDLASAAGVALIPLLYVTVGLPFWALLALVFLAGLLTTPGATARSALVPDLAQLAHVRLERATAATDSVTRLSRFIGAPLAGVLIALIGTSNLLWIDAATFAFSAILIGRAVPMHMAPLVALPLSLSDVAADRSILGEATPVALATPQRGYLAGLREGIAFIRRDPVLLSTTLVVLVTNLLDAGYAGVLLPAFVKQVYGSAVWLGAMIAAFSGAAFAGAVAFGTVGHKLPRRLALGLGFTLGGAVRFFVAVGLASRPLVMLAILAVCGFCLGPVNPLFDTIAYERVPVALRARVFGAITAGSMIGAPLGGLLAGALGPWIGVEPSMLVFGSVYLLATTSLLVNPALRAIAATPKS